MKTWGTVDVEVEVHPDDVIEAIHTLPKPDRLSSAMRGLNKCLVFLKNMPNDSIMEMDNAQRQVISDALQRQYARYLPPPTNTENTRKESP